jgi:hypothetical protein
MSNRASVPAGSSVASRKVKEWRGDAKEGEEGSDGEEESEREGDEESMMLLPSADTVAVAVGVCPPPCPVSGCRG